MDGVGGWGPVGWSGAQQGAVQLLSLSSLLREFGVNVVPLLNKQSLMLLRKALLHPAASSLQNLTSPARPSQEALRLALMSLVEDDTFLDLFHQKYSQALGK